jgi:hypothetical protein
MVIRLLRSDLPFVDRAASAFSSDTVFGREMFSEKTMRLLQILEQRQAIRITLCHDESGWTNDLQK